MQDNFVLLLVLGLVAGIFAGMFGIGGGVVIVPALILLLGFTTLQAVSTSLLALLLPVGIFGVMSYYNAGKLSIRTAGWVALGLLLTNRIGAEIAIHLPQNTLQQLYGVFLYYVAWRFAEPRVVWREYRAGGKSVAADPAVVKNADDTKPIAWYVFFGIGLFAGVFSGMFGIGGGLIIVPLLVGFYKFDQKLANGISLGALLLPVGLPSVLRYYENGVLNIPVAVPVAFGLVGGGLIGARIALGLPSRQVKRLYGVFLFFVGTWFILEPIVTAAH